MDSDSLTVFFHPERKDHVVSLYKNSRGAYVSVDYSKPYKLFDLDFEEGEDIIGPKVIVEWSK